MICCVIYDNICDINDLNDVPYLCACVIVAAQATSITTLILVSAGTNWGNYTQDTERLLQEVLLMIASGEQGGGIHGKKFKKKRYA